MTDAADRSGVEPAPMAALRQAAMIDLAEPVRWMREKGWPAEVMLEVDGDDYLLSVNIRLSLNMPRPVEAKRG